MVNYSLYGFVLNTVIGWNNYNAMRKLNKPIMRIAFGFDFNLEFE